MLRHFIHPFFTKYSCMKPSRFDRRIFKILLLDSVSKIGNNFLSKGTVSLTTCLIKLAYKYLLSKKKVQAKQIAVGIGMLSGCCFSKGSDEYEPIQQTSEPIEQTGPITEQLSATAQSLLSEVKDNTIFVCSNEGLDNRTFSGCTDNNDKGMEAPPNVVADKTEECLVTLAEGAVADNDVVYKGTEKCKRQKLSKKMKKALRGDGASQVEDKSRRRKPARISPNYFVAFQVTNSEIRNAMKEIQNHITVQDSRFASSMEPISKSHVTLMVMYLDDKEHSRALDVLKDIHKEFNETMHTSPLKLQFTGIGNFGNKVVFVKLQEDEGLQRLRDCAERIQYHFNNAEITSTDDSGKQFNPHLTIMKLSRDPSLFRKGVRKISPALYKAYENHPFGVEVIKSIQLLSMKGALDENGYYQGIDLPFDVRDPEEVDKNANF